MPVTTSQPQQYNANFDQQYRPRASGAVLCPPNSQDAHPQQAPPPPPRWVAELLDASQAGDKEFRKEVRKAIVEDNHGAELIRIFTELEARETDEQKKKEAGEMLADIKHWVEDPSELEEGGRFLGLHRMGRMGGMMGSYYSPYTVYNSYNTYYPAYGGLYSYYPVYGFW